MDVSVWTGALSAAVSRGSAPLVVGACRRGNTRVTAVIGGLVLALASLFTSFALHTHQVLLRCVERGDRITRSVVAFPFFPSSFPPPLTRPARSKVGDDRYAGSRASAIRSI